MSMIDIEIIWSLSLMTVVVFAFVVAMFKNL